MLELTRSDTLPHRSRCRVIALLASLAGAAAAVGQVGPAGPVEAPPLRPADPSPATPPPPPPPPPPPGPVVGEAQQEVLDAHVYDISALVFRYAIEHADMPTVDQLLDSDVTLGVREGVYVSPRAGLPSVTLSLRELASPQRARRQFAASALNTLAAGVVEFYNERGLVGVAVIPSPEQVDPRTLEDLRPPELRTLVMDIWVRTVADVRTMGTGPRWERESPKEGRPGLETRINSPLHWRVRANSPAIPGDLLRREEVERYIHRLDRHPGRRVDATVAAAEQPGEVVLDYVITENRPWTVYFQASNTGTEETSDWRERFGFIHNQLTNRDDILTLDYITANFDEVNAVLGSYDAPLMGSPVTRWRVYGSASEYTASDVGFVGEDFRGDSVGFGGELSTNVLQVKRAFVDVFGGARWMRVHVDNVAAEVEGRADFFLPYAGVRFERASYRGITNAEVRIETNLAGLADTDSEQVQQLGRLDVDRDWTALKWNVGHAFYLEPLLFRRDWGSPDAPFRRTTLAHEVALSFRGQFAFGNRLIPQEEETAGGLYSVRGYPESLAAGDNVYIATAEYRFHMPRVFSPRQPATVMGRPFRLAPEDRYLPPDWDLILRGFLDVGRASINDRQPFESNETLVGAGIGAELLVLRNLSLRLDWGFALRDARDVDTGDNRVHFVGTILY